MDEAFEKEKAHGCVTPSRGVKQIRRYKKLLEQQSALPERLDLRGSSNAIDKLLNRIVLYLAIYELLA